jgi:RNA polymerase sigma-70 factor (ECF subfamily)
MQKNIKNLPMHIPDGYFMDSESTKNLHSFEALFRDYYQRLCLYACTYVHDPDDAEGIVKDIFVKLWEERETIDIKTSQISYLYTAVRNQCINFIQREQKNWRERITGLSDDISVSDDSDPSGELIARELEERIAQLVDALPPQCREIFMMSRYDNLSHEQIAQALNVSTGTIKTQIFRALNKIRAGLSDYLPTIAVIWGVGEFLL